MSNRLGKGLGAIFNENTYLTEEQHDNEQIIHLPLKELRKNPYQPRKIFDEEKIGELAQSILENGVLQPIIVTRVIDGKGYYIVAGERRTRACERLNLESIPAIIRDIPQQAMAELALLENLQREDLTVLEEAKAYDHLMNQYQLTQQEIAFKVGKSRSHIANVIRILSLPSVVQTYLEENKIEFGHAKILAGFEDNLMVSSWTERIVQEHLSVRALEQLLKETPNDKPKTITKKASLPRDIHLNFLEEQLMMKLGTPLKIVNKDNGGKLVIDYNDETDLNRILKIMNMEEIANISD